jgi:uncharacterized protein YukE
MVTDPAASETEQTAMLAARAAETTEDLVAVLRREQASITWSGPAATRHSNDVFGSLQRLETALAQLREATAELHAAAERAAGERDGSMDTGDADF